MIRTGLTAHRGDASRAPENTLRAFRLALELGVDWIETDVRRTRDGRLVLLHDDRTGRTCDLDLVVGEATWAELSGLDAATEFRKRHRLDVEACPKEPIPLLEEALRLLASHPATRLSLQPKDDCVPEILRAVQAENAADRVGFNDGHLERLQQARRALPGVPVFWDRGPSDPIRSDVAIAAAHGFQAIVLHDSLAAAPLADAIRQGGLEAGLWTVNDPLALAQWRQSGFTRFYTDDPAAMIQKSRDDSLAHFARRPEIIGHRGCSAEAPENTLPSIRLAWEQQADAVEIDVTLTRDRDILAMHDHTPKRYTGIDRLPGDLTRAEFESMDFGAWKEKRWAGTKPAFFDEILATIPPGKRLVTEIKAGPEIVPALATAIQRWGGDRDQVVFIAFSLEVMKEVRVALPGHECYWLLDFRPEGDGWAPDYREAIATARTLGFSGLDVGTRGPYDAFFAEAIRSSGLGLMVWTVNDPETARRFIALGAHGLTTDKPGWLKNALRGG
ncbi:MAG: hypothetical protein J0L75_05170 [Spirochaetes bacterium]|nr:hypothetical protein [Spirochaetota bacterium]